MRDIIAADSMLSPAFDVGHALDEGRWTPYQKLLVALSAVTIVFDGIDNQLLGVAIPSLMREWADGLKKANTLADLLDATQEQIAAREGAAPARVFLHLDQGEELYTRAQAASPRDAESAAMLSSSALSASASIASTIMARPSKPNPKRRARATYSISSS